jgi:L-gulono-1,4-lactone dehydrogenase
MRLLSAIAAVGGPKWGSVMDTRERHRLAFHGLAIFVLGLVIAIPFAIAFGKGNDAHTHLWSVAHLEAMIHGLLLMGLGAVGAILVLPRNHIKWVVGLLITGSYSSVVADTVGAIWDVLGLKPGKSVANTVAWAFHGYGTVAVCVGLVWLLVGARRGYRAEQDASDQPTEVVELPQFGSGPKHPVVIEPALWTNWGGTQTAKVVALYRPQSLLELTERVRQAVADGLRVKAVGGSYSWSGGAVTNGVVIDMSNLDRPISYSPAIGSSPATVTVEAGMTIHQLSDYAATLGYTLATTTVIPWVQIGGALGNGCHGTGRDVATLCDQVTAMDVVDASGEVTHYERDGSDTWRALLVSLGALGILYSVTLECVPMYNVHSVDLTMPMHQAMHQVEALAANNECMELFWFPFNENSLVKTWNRTDLVRTEGLPNRAWDDFVQAIENGVLAQPLREALRLDPRLTPSICRTMFALMPKLDVVCEVPWAMQYQTVFAPVVDTSWAIPIEPGYEKVKQAWNAAVAQVEAYALRAEFPVNMVLHARFVGHASTALLSPTEGHAHGSCMIEILTFTGTAGYDSFFAELGRTWKSLGGRPHWAKLIYDPHDMAALYGENMVRFRRVRDQLDPQGVFMNDFLTEVLGGSSVG